MPAGHVADRGRHRRRGAGARGARPDGGLRRPGQVGRLEGLHRQADQERRQRRASADPTLARSWRTRRCGTTPRRDLVFRFVSNVDSTDFVEATRDLAPDETLFIISSKTFGTLETLTNATSARDWIVGAARRRGRGGQALRRGVHQRRARREVRHRHRLTCSASGTGSAGGTRWTRPSACPPWSRSGPSGSARCWPGSTRWTSTSAPRPLEQNLPVLMGLLAVWYRDFFGCQTYGVMPYEQYLKRFPAYLQQLTMESNGKHVTLAGARVDLRHRRGLLGRARHQRPAQLLPAHPPGNHDDPGRPDRVRQDPRTRCATTTTSCPPTCSRRPRRWPSARPRKRSGRGHARARGAAPGDGRQPAHQRAAGRDPHAADPRHTGRPVRAQRVHPGSDLGHRLVRPVGSGTREGRSRSRSSPS